MSYALIAMLLAGAVGTWHVLPRCRLGTAHDTAQGTTRGMHWSATGQPKTPRAGPVRVDELAFADDLDLFALCLGAGLPISDATRAVAGAAANSTAKHWARAATLTGVGIPADRAFADLGDVAGFDELARLARRFVHSGSAIAGGCHELAARVRADAAACAVARAERASVLIALPLTGCFLPAFVVLGLAPVVISLGSDLLSR